MDWIYPPACSGCDIPGVRYCPTCQNNMVLLNSKLCQQCGQPLFSSTHNVCASCQENPPSFNQIRSLAIYDGSIRNAILKMKFKQDFGISEYLGEKLAHLFSQLNWTIDMIIPVPLSIKRQKERGFNQSFRLSIPIALHTGIPIISSALTRNINTQSQAELPKEDRQINVLNAFSSDSKIVKDKSVLIVDDIATTSSTINACSVALIKKGAKDVFGITVARAVL